MVLKLSLQIPRAAALRITQPGHDFEQTLHAGHDLLLGL